MAIGLPTTRGSQSSMFGSWMGGSTSSSGSSATKAAPVQAVQLGGNLGGSTGYGNSIKSTPTPQASSTSSGVSALGSSINSLISSMSGGGGGQAAPAVTYNPAPLTVQATQNPQLQALIGESQAARQNLSQGSDQDAQLALQRQRDLISGQASEFGADAASRGILNSGAAQQDLLKRVVNPGQQALGQLNANLASDARSKQLSALGQEANLVGNQAQLTQNQQQFGLQTWQAQQQAQQAQAQLAAMQQNQGLNNLSSVIGLIGQLGNLYSGF